LKYISNTISSFTLKVILLFLDLRELQGCVDAKDVKWRDPWALGMSKTTPNSILGRDLRK